MKEEFNTMENSQQGDFEAQAVEDNRKLPLVLLVSDAISLFFNDFAKLAETVLKKK